MNPVTRKIRDKGYNLNEFCAHMGYSLRWYRQHANKNNRQGKKISAFVHDMDKNNFINDMGILK